MALRLVAMDLPQNTPSARALRREPVVWTGQNLSLAHLSFIFAIIVNNNQAIVFFNVFLLFCIFLCIQWANIPGDGSIIFNSVGNFHLQ